MSRSGRACRSCRRVRVDPQPVAGRASGSGAVSGTAGRSAASAPAANPVADRDRGVARDLHGGARHHDRQRRAAATSPAASRSSADEASWVVTTYLVANAIMLTASSFLAKRSAARRFFIVCLGAVHGHLVSVRLRVEPAVAAGVSACSRASPAAAWCRSRSRSWPIPSRRRSAGRPSRCSASPSSWRRWSGRRSAAGSPTMSPGTGAS